MLLLYSVLQLGKLVSECCSGNLFRICDKLLLIKIYAETRKLSSRLIQTDTDRCIRTPTDPYPRLVQRGLAREKRNY